MASSPLPLTRSEVDSIQTLIVVEVERERPGNQALFDFGLMQIPILGNTDMGQDLKLCNVDKGSEEHGSGYSPVVAPTDIMIESIDRPWCITTFLGKAVKNLEMPFWKTVEAKKSAILDQYGRVGGKTLRHDIETSAPGWPHPRGKAPLG